MYCNKTSFTLRTPYVSLTGTERHMKTLSVGRHDMLSAVSAVSSLFLFQEWVTADVEEYPQSSFSAYSLTVKRSTKILFSIQKFTCVPLFLCTHNGPFRSKHCIIS